MHTDIDECNSSNGGCAQLCNNTVGSFFCGCNEGYLLNTDDADCDGTMKFDDDNNMQFVVLYYVYRH